MYKEMRVYVFYIMTRCSRILLIYTFAIARGYGEGFKRFGTPRATIKFDTTKKLGGQRTFGLSYSAIID